MNDFPPNADEIVAELSIDDVMDVIEEMESGGDVNAIGDNGAAFGCMQIQQGCLDDYKRWHPKDETIQSLSLIDLQGDTGRTISRAIFVDYMKHYATKNRIGDVPSYEDMARIWNGGPNGWNKNATRGYGYKFMRLALSKAAEQSKLL